MNLDGWMPASVFWSGSEATVESILMRERLLLEPFYAQTIQSVMTHPFHQLFRRKTSMPELVEWASQNPGVPLRGLIFHMSRCGSTLMAQMLAAVESNIVASEPAPFDELVRACEHAPGLARSTQVEWLRAMAAALGQARTGDEKALYLKLDCWHIHEIGLIREAFPSVPCLFLYRDPLEVMVSHQRGKGAWTVPGLLPPRALRLEMKDWDPTCMEVYTARALAGICEAALSEVPQHGGLLVNYSELPEAMYGRIREHFNIAEEDLTGMRKQARQDAKSPQISFESDTEDKHKAATERLREIVAEHLQPVCLRLEAVRTAQLEAVVPASGSLVGS